MPKTESEEANRQKPLIDIEDPKVVMLMTDKECRNWNLA
jgi:hypothetical protein